jgi:hypothetical protein
MTKDILAIFNLQGLGRRLEGFEVRGEEVSSASRRAVGPGVRIAAG